MATFEAAMRHLQCAGDVGAHRLVECRQCPGRTGRRDRRRGQAGSDRLQGLHPRCTQRRGYVQRPPFAEQQGPIDDGGEFPDIAGPVIGAQQGDIGPGRLHDRKAKAVRGAAGEMGRQIGEVRLALPQGRQQHRKRCEPVPEIFAKAPRQHHGRQITMRGGDHAHVDV